MCKGSKILQNSVASRVIGTLLPSGSLCNKQMRQPRYILQCPALGDTLSGPQSSNRVAIASFWRTIPSWWKNQPRLVRVGSARLSPFTIVTITYKVAVYAPAERADTLTLFNFYQYMYSVYSLTSLAVLSCLSQLHMLLLSLVRPSM
jgi:hypothetical protein